MPDWVPKGGRAIRIENADDFAEYLQQFIDRGHVAFHASRTEEVAATAADIVQAERSRRARYRTGARLARLLLHKTAPCATVSA